MTKQEEIKARLARRIAARNPTLNAGEIDAMATAALPHHRLDPFGRLHVTDGNALARAGLGALTQTTHAERRENDARFEAALSGVRFHAPAAPAESAVEAAFRIRTGMSLAAALSTSGDENGGAL